MTKETICTNGQGGPGMLKIARGRQIFLWHRGVPPSPPPFPKWICQTEKGNFPKKYENFLTKLQKRRFLESAYQCCRFV